DLGLALEEGEEGEPEVVGGRGYVVGSMDYVAPEQTTDAAKVDGRADIYGMGCTLYFALTGRPPFPGGSNREKIKRHRNEEPQPVTDLNPKVSEEFAYIVSKMMAKDPERRFPTAASVRDVLSQWAGGVAELPLDQQSDPAYHEAIAALEVAEVSPELARDVIALAAEVLPDADEESESRSDYTWIIIGLAGFWLFLLVVMGLVFLLR